MPSPQVIRRHLNRNILVKVECVISKTHVSVTSHPKEIFGLERMKRKEKKKQDRQNAGYFNGRTSSCPAVSCQLKAVGLIIFCFVKNFFFFFKLNCGWAFLFNSCLSLKNMS